MSAAHEYVLGTMSGRQRGFAAGALRALLRCAEPAYAAAMLLRNRMYDRRIWRVADLPGPTISVGNITAGGTGKTPMVAWVAQRLSRHGLRPAVLMRGYGAGPDGASDEQALLESLLNAGVGEWPAVPVCANPDRVAAATEALRRDPQIGAFILDDAFQHRRVSRRMDLVLISAPEPFGFGHVHPRGLLREPLRGLARADALVITRADEVTAEALADLESVMRRYNAFAPLYRAEHRQTGLLAATDRLGAAATQPLDALRGRSCMTLLGIADPASFQRQIERLGAVVTGRCWMPDHHRFTDADLAQARSAARAAGAEWIITSEKDWARLRGLAGASEGDPPILRVAMTIAFRGDDEAALERQILERIQPAEAPASQGQPAGAAG